MAGLRGKGRLCLFTGGFLSSGGQGLVCVTVLGELSLRHGWAVAIYFEETASSQLEQDQEQSLDCSMIVRHRN